LAAAERTGAELIGCQELSFDQRRELVLSCFYPPDPGPALRVQHTQALLHPSSLVSRDLVMRIGGFSSGLRFGGDMEFQLRAHHAGHAANIRRFCYYRRRRPDSLWTSPDTGKGSTARLEQEARIKAASRANATRVALGQEPDLSPAKRSEPIA